MEQGSPLFPGLLKTRAGTSSGFAGCEVQLHVAESARRTNRRTECRHGGVVVANRATLQEANKRFQLRANVAVAEPGAPAYCDQFERQAGLSELHRSRIQPIVFDMASLTEDVRRTSCSGA